jgi:hypothetical protein
VKATPGRIVHYVRPEAVVRDCLAAIVTGPVRGDPDAVTLTVFEADGISILPGGVRQGEAPGTWHWPEREQ